MLWRMRSFSNVGWGNVMTEEEVERLIPPVVG